MIRMPAPIPPSGRPARVLATMAAGICAVGLAACAATGDDPTGVVSITVKPGDTGTCDTSPCQVSLVMPPGTGTFEVTGNETRIGEYPAGQTVNLGSFFSSQAIKIKGANVPPTYVYIPQEG